MKCPRCKIEFNQGHWGECPHCGEVHDPGIDGVIRTSTILISTEGGGVFRSLEEVPESLRERLVATTTSANSATIVIADQGGRERIAAALRNLPRGSAEKIEIVPCPQPRVRAAVSLYWWVGVLAAISAAGLTWLVCSRLL